MSDTDRRRKLRPEDVRYLALEGGGGKGHAYLGAIEALEELGVMNQVKGYAGASAGAITALMLATGMRSAKIRAYMETTDFDAFFDPPEPRGRPEAGTGGRLVEPQWTQKEKNLLLFFDVAKPLLNKIAAVVADAVAPELVAEVTSKRDRQPFKALLENWPRYLTFLGRDMGLFEGAEARRAWDRLLTARLQSRVYAPNAHNLTFREHERHFGTVLLMTGSNLSTGRTEIFSAEHTPHFPVADAVRISMSLPFIYKPYVIDGNRPGWPPCGTYVDGGLWNNLPFREFDEGPDPQSAAPPASAAAPAPVTGVTPRTLALRLTIDAPLRVRNLGGLLKRAGMLGLFGTGESQVLSTYTNQTVLLDTEGLDLVDFTPPKEAKELAVKRARRAVYRYFDRPVLPKDEDPADDAEVEARWRDSRACG
ncbi:patatin-like phospholipase family protein [Streptomyces sp. NPDC059063]|uniref:patatin-like phospholipase family protein n=1 Tax=unclassified Streptomyces TaxID=2593676 RepID=UPI0036905964